MSKDIFDGLDSVLSKSADGELLIDTETDYSKVNPEGADELDENGEKKKVDDKIEIPEGKDTNAEIKEPEDNTEVTNIYKPLASLLKEEGILPTLDLEKFEGKPEELIAGIQAEIKDGVEGYKESIPEKIKKLIEDYEDGVPLDELIGIQSEQMRFDAIDENEIKEDKELQKNLVAYHLTQTTKWSEAKIKKEVDRLADVDELESEAFDAHKELKKLAVEAEKELRAQAKIAEAKKIKEAKETSEKIEKTVGALTEIIPGIKITEKEKQALLKSITKPVAYSADGKQISKAMQEKEKDPIKFELMLNYFIDKGFFDGKFDIVLTKAKSESLKQLEEQARTTLSKVGKNHINPSSTGSDLLNNFKKINKN